jgi:hypothetical protein
MSKATINVVADALSHMDADHLKSYNLPDGDEDIKESIQHEKQGNHPDDKTTPEYVFCPMLRRATAFGC